MMRFSLLSLCALRPARGFAAAALRARRPRAAPRVARFSVSGAVWEARDASAPVVELYTKEGCTLCDEAKAVLASCRDDADHALTAVDITDPDKTRWLAKYKYDIPVLHVDGQYWTKHRVTAEEAVAAIGEAAAGDFAPRRGQPDASRAEV